MAFRVEHNIDEVMKLIDKTQRAINTETRRIVRNASKAVKQEARARVPIDEGELHDSIDVMKIKAGRGRDFGYIRGGVEATAEHASYVEHDLSLQHDQGQAKFLTTSGLDEEDNVHREAEDGLKRVMKKTLGK